MDAMRRGMCRGIVRERRLSVTHVTAEDIERVIAPGREDFVGVEMEVLEAAEAEVSGVEEVVVRYGRLVSRPEEQEVKLLYPHPHEYFS